MKPHYRLRVVLKPVGLINPELQPFWRLELRGKVEDHHGYCYQHGEFCSAFTNYAASRMAFQEAALLATRSP